MATLAGSIRVSASASDEAQVRAAFLVGFMKLVQWPADVWQMGGDTLTVCVLGDTRLLQALNLQSELVVQGRPVRGRNIDGLHDTSTCQVLLIGRTYGSELASQVANLARASILTVSDRPEDAKLAVITLVPANDRLTFEVSLDAAKRARLSIGSQLLRIAARVDGRARSSS